MMAWFHLDLPMSQHAQYQDEDTITPKWNTAMIHVCCCSVFPMTSHNFMRDIIASMWMNFLKKQTNIKEVHRESDFIKVISDTMDEQDWVLTRICH